MQGTLLQWDDAWTSVSTTPPNVEGTSPTSSDTWGSNYASNVSEEWVWDEEDAESQELKQKGSTLTPDCSASDSSQIAGPSASHSGGKGLKTAPPELEVMDSNIGGEEGTSPPYTLSPQWLLMSPHNVRQTLAVREQNMRMDQYFWPYYSSQEERVRALREYVNTLPPSPSKLDLEVEELLKDL